MVYKIATTKRFDKEYKKLSKADRKATKNIMGISKKSLSAFFRDTRRVLSRRNSTT